MHEMFIATLFVITKTPSVHQQTIKFQTWIEKDSHPHN